ncbi:MAG: hypothetical protein FJX67_18495, partial [Alphaproteobacteria bacterium]|nr:hypothetical protein [Alphaproteobacteria bacterium]
MASFFSAQFSALPWDRVSLFVRRRLEEIAGLVAVAAAALLVLALASWRAGDPSWNTAAAGPVHNWLGQPGASAADVLFQTVGVAAWLVVVAALAWGWRLVSHRGLGRLWVRLAMLVAGLVLATIAVAGIGWPGAWPFATGPGGVLGQLLHARAADLVTGWGGAILVDWLWLAAAILAALFLLYAIALGAAEWRAMGRAA